MKNKGFTLIELLAVISILAIILVITTPNIVSILQNSKANLNNRQIEQIENAARNWGTANLTLKNGVPSQNFITIKELQDLGYLQDKEIKDLTTKNKLDEQNKICITWQNNQFIYKYTKEENCPNE